MILVIDNYDSFTFNLVQRMGEVDPSLDIRIFRNDAISLEEIERLSPERILISPGPCTPSEAGVSIEVIRRFGPRIPTLGVCLGHQSIGQCLGGKIVRAPRLMHGKTDRIFHDDKGFFAGLENPFVATRYHSLVIDPPSLPDCLEVSAWVNDPEFGKIIMGVRHKSWPLEGWQFHPESFLTQPGIKLITRFLQWNSGSMLTKV